MLNFKKHLRKYFVVTMVLLCLGIFLSGTVIAYERTQYNLTGEKYRVFSLESITQMIKNY